jgi:uncharacterized protein GlcG (DUF336 family)
LILNFLMERTMGFLYENNNANSIVKSGELMTFAKDKNCNLAQLALRCYFSSYITQRNEPMDAYNWRTIPSSKRSGSLKDNLMKITVEKKYVTYELASHLIQAAIEHAKTINLSICVAIVDPAGQLIAFAKMDDCCLIGIGTAQGKAYTAARSGLSTREFLAYLRDNEVDLSSLQKEKLVIITGGLPILYHGVLIGGIGIGGGTGAQDEECAQNALNSLIQL